MGERTGWRLLLWSIPAAGAVALAALAFWLLRGPSVRPAEVQVRALLQPPGVGENLKYPDRWTLEIIVDRETALPLHRAGAWTHLVMPYADGMLNPHRDYPQGQEVRSLDTGRDGGSHYHIVGVSWQMEAMAQALRAEGITAPQNLERMWGFSYAGPQPQARIRFYLQGKGPPDPSRMRVVYRHVERRWWRDLSWSRAFPVHLSAVDGDQAARAALGLEPDQVLHRAPFPGGLLGDRRFDGGQALLWQPEPDRYTVAAALNLGYGHWVPASNLTTIAVKPGEPFIGTALLNPPWDRERKAPIWAIFGRVDDPRTGIVRIDLPGGKALRSEVRDGLWLAVHLGPLETEEAADLYYFTRGGTLLRREPVRLPR